MEAALRADSRAGARAILQAIERRRFENRAEGQRLRRLMRYEWSLWDKGVLQVAGVDEAGMSPLAGPVSAAAVIFLPGSRIPGVDDSKKLSAAERERLAAEIKRSAVAWSVGFAEVSEIDTINIYWASQLAMKRAVAGLSVRPDHVLIDGRRVKDMEIAQQPIIKGDAKSMTIAAASILAKTARDALMHKLDAKHPGYGFSNTRAMVCPSTSQRSRLWVPVLFIALHSRQCDLSSAFPLCRPGLAVKQADKKPQFHVSTKKFEPAKRGASPLPAKAWGNGSPARPSRRADSGQRRMRGRGPSPKV